MPNLLGGLAIFRIASITWENGERKSAFLFVAHFVNVGIKFVIGFPPIHLPPFNFDLNLVSPLFNLQIVQFPTANKDFAVIKMEKSVFFETVRVYIDTVSELCGTLAKCTWGNNLFSGLW